MPSYLKKWSILSAIVLFALSSGCFKSSRSSPGESGPAVSFDKNKTLAHWVELRGVVKSCDELLRNKPSADQAATHFRRAAENLEQFPILGVDGELVGFSNRLRGAMRELSRSAENAHLSTEPQAPESFMPNTRQRLDTIETEMGDLRFRLTQMYGIEFPL